MGILGVYHHKTDLDDDNREDDPDTIINVRLLAWLNKFEKRQALKIEISKELMYVARHPTRWWSQCMS